MTQQQPAQDTTPLGVIIAYIRDREQRGRPINRIAMSLERVLVSESDILGGDDPARVVERMEVGYQIALARADGTRVDNELMEDRSRSKGTIPTGKPGKSDPTARQAEGKIDLQRIDLKLRNLARRHGIPLPDEPAPREAIDESQAEVIEQILERGWTIQQIEDEMHGMGMLATQIRLRAATVQRHLRARCRVCQSPRRAEVDAMLAGGSTVREIEEWLQGEGIEISDSTIGRHRGH